jgi:hypothetical protein
MLIGTAHFQALREPAVTFMDPQPSREYVALSAGQELAAYAFIRAWMADDVDKGMLLIEEHHVPEEAAPHELEVEAAGLIRAALTGDAFAIDRIFASAGASAVMEACASG